MRLLEPMKSHSIALLASLATFVFLVLTIAQVGWLEDECYDMLTGQGYLQFLLNPSANSLWLNVLGYMHSPTAEAAGAVNHPFFAKLVIGVSMLLGGVSVPRGLPALDCTRMVPTMAQLFWARLPATMITALAVFAVCSMLSRRFGSGPAILGVLLMLSDFTFRQYARMATLDIYAASFLVAAFTLLVTSPNFGFRRMSGSAILAGLMLASKFASGVFFFWFIMLVMATRRFRLKGLLAYAAISLTVFFLVDFYYFMVRPPYLFNALLAQGRGGAESVLTAAGFSSAFSSGPLSPLVAIFYFYIPNRWPILELALVTASLALAAFMKVKGIDRVGEIDMAFFAIILLGSTSFVWERPLVLVAPFMALFVSATIAKLTDRYFTKRLASLIIVLLGAALLIQIANPTVFPFYPASSSVWQVGDALLLSLALFGGALSISLLRDRQITTWFLGDRRITISFLRRQVTNARALIVIVIVVALSLVGAYYARIPSQVTTLSTTIPTSTITTRVAKAVTAHGNAQIDSSQSKFGGASGKFVANSYLSTPDSTDFHFGTNDFTIDFWVRFNSLPSDGRYQGFIGQGTDGNNYWFFGVMNSSGTYQLNLWSISGGTSYVLFEHFDILNLKWDVTLSTATWYHIALVRSSSTFYAFLNGFSQGNFTSSSSFHSSNADLEIADSVFNGPLDGWLDEFRVSNRIARWISNFTPPSDPYMPDSSTALLLHMDGTNGSRTFLDVSGATLGLTGTVTRELESRKLQVSGGWFKECEACGGSGKKPRQSH